MFVCCLQGECMLIRGVLLVQWHLHSQDSSTEDARTANGETVPWPHYILDITKFRLHDTVPTTDRSHRWEQMAVGPLRWNDWTSYFQVPPRDSGRPAENSLHCKYLFVTRNTPHTNSGGYTDLHIFPVYLQRSNQQTPWKKTTIWDRWTN
jgi:hypothetical protein